MKEETIERLIRTAMGTSLLIVHSITNVNGLLVAVALFLLGAPLELLRVVKKEEKKDEE